MKQRQPATRRFVLTAASATVTVMLFVAVMGATGDAAATAQKPRCRHAVTSHSAAAAAAADDNRRLRRDADGILRTSGSNCNAAGLACSMCCNGTCCEDVSGTDPGKFAGQHWIPVHFAFVSSSAASFDDAATHGRIANNLKTMNRIFGPSNLWFFSASATHHSDPRMVAACDTNQCDPSDPGSCDFLSYLMPRVKKDTSRSIPVVLCDQLPYLGEAQTPWTAVEDSPEHYVQMDASTLGADNPAYLGGLGYTLVHEMGHYFGLLHVFEPTCSANGDWVNDTAPTKTAATEETLCDAVLDSCPALPGNDPVDNYMNYAADDCMERFTAGQWARMRQSLRRYRPLLLRNTAAPTGSCPATSANLSDCTCGNGNSPASHCKDAAVPGPPAPPPTPTDTTAVITSTMFVSPFNTSSTALPTALPSTVPPSQHPPMPPPPSSPAASMTGSVLPPPTNPASTHPSTTAMVPPPAPTPDPANVWIRHHALTRLPRNQTCASVAASRCPLQECLMPSTTTCAPRCPAGRVFCPATGTCATDASSCLSRCPAGTQRCWDSSCAATFARCPCPPNAPNRCPTGHCARELDACSAASECEGSTLCWDSTCASNAAECACPPTRPVRCPAGTPGAGVCRSNPLECLGACPPQLAHKCDDGSCAARPADCPCGTPSQYRCAVQADTCIDDVRQCPCGATMAAAMALDPPELRCFSGECLPAASATSEPSPSADGCAGASESALKCYEGPRPVLALDGATTNDADVDATTTVRATLGAVRCGRVVVVQGVAQTQIRWLVHKVLTTASDATSASSVVPLSAGSVVGPVLTLPPGALEANATYVAYAYARLGNTTVSARRVLRAVRSPVVVSLDGAVDRDVVGTRGFDFSVSVSPTSSSQVALVWLCCRTPLGAAEGRITSNCTQRCEPALDAAFRAAENSTRLQVSAAVAANLTLGRRYIAIVAPSSSSLAFAQFNVVAAGTPTVQIIMPRSVNWAASPTGPTVRFTALVSTVGVGPESDVTYAWSVEGAFATSTGPTWIELQPASDGPWRIAVRVCLVAQPAVCGAASVVYTDVPVPLNATAICTAVPVATGGNATAPLVIGRDALSASTTGVRITAGRLFEFLLRFVDSEGEVRLVPLQPARSATPRLDPVPIPAIVGITTTASATTANNATHVTIILRVYAGAAEVAGEVACTSGTVPLRVAPLNSTERAEQTASAVSQLQALLESTDATAATIIAASAALPVTIATDELHLRALANASLRCNASAAACALDDAVTRTGLEMLANVAASLSISGRFNATANVQRTIGSTAVATAQRLVAHVRSAAAANAAVRVTARLRLLAVTAALRQTLNAVAAVVTARVAANVDVGESVTVTEGNLTVASARHFIASLGGQQLQGRNVRVKLPSNFQLSVSSSSSSTDAAALTATTYSSIGDSPINASTRLQSSGGATNGTNPNARLVSSLVEVKVVLESGAAARVSGLASPIQLTITIMAAPGVGRRLMCTFYNETSAAWSTEGVTLAAMNASAMSVVCNTTHLTVFAVQEVDDEATAAPMTTTVTAATAATTTTTTTTSGSGTGGRASTTTVASSEATATTTTITTNAVSTSPDPPTANATTPPAATPVATVGVALTTTAPAGAEVPIEGSGDGDNDGANGTVIALVVVVIILVVAVVVGVICFAYRRSKRGTGQQGSADLDGSSPAAVKYASPGPPEQQQQPNAGGSVAGNDDHEQQRRERERFDAV